VPWCYRQNATLINADLTAADARGASNLELPSSAITTNLIRPDGHVNGLELDTDRRLIVRDYDGNPNNYDQYGNLNPISLIPITVDEHLAMGPGGTLRMVFEADVWDSTISFAPGIPVTLGGTLELTFAADVSLASQVGRTFDLFDWTGVNPTGAFAVSSPYAWNLSNLYTTGEVTLTAVPEPTTIPLVIIIALAFCLSARVSITRASLMATRDKTASTVWNATTYTAAESPSLMRPTSALKARLLLPVPLDSFVHESLEALFDLPRKRTAALAMRDSRRREPFDPWHAVEVAIVTGQVRQTLMFHHSSRQRVVAQQTKLLSNLRGRAQPCGLSRQDVHPRLEQIIDCRTEAVQLPQHGRLPFQPVDNLGGPAEQQLCFQDHEPVRGLADDMYGREPRDVARFDSPQQLVAIRTENRMWREVVNENVRVHEDLRARWNRSQRHAFSFGSNSGESAMRSIVSASPVQPIIPYPATSGEVSGSTVTRTFSRSLSGKGCASLSAPFS
jgi:hypothetical protein